MKKILIIYPHWPPSNLAGVHRARLIANFLPELGWQPLVLTVKSEFYEETPDWDMLKTVSPDIQVYYTDAKTVRKPRIIGDIALRAFNNLKKEALKIIAAQKPDFLWIPIPSFYTAILGRILHDKTGILYGIDYIDPWIRDISKRRNMRAILSLQIARLLEPYAVKNASLISGVSENYYRQVLERNFRNRLLEHVAMPYGFDPHDHEIVLENIELPWQNIANCKALVYAGAFLPNAAYYTQKLFALIKEQIDKALWDKNMHLFFLGTGNYPHKSITEFAKEAGISVQVHEIRQRFPFLHILNFLSKAYGILVIGSTEEHYTASKIYQSLLSTRPIFAVFHQNSSVCEVLEECNAANYLVKYIHEGLETVFVQNLTTIWTKFSTKKLEWQADLSTLNKYSARNSALKLVEAMNRIV